MAVSDVSVVEESSVGKMEIADISTPEPTWLHVGTKTTATWSVLPATE